jgi:hypothetical protein
MTTLSPGIPFALGEAAPVLVALGIHKWKIFEIVTSCIMAVAAICWVLLPESPRWLIANGKTEEATKVIQAAAKRNGVQLSAAVLQGDPEKKEEAVELEVYGLADMFRPSQLRITLAFFVTWPVVTLLYYGDCLPLPPSRRPYTLRRQNPNLRGCLHCGRAGGGH